MGQDTSEFTVPQLERIEAHYRRSTFVDDVCVVPQRAASGAAGALHAVVLPDLATLRARRIVNIRELIRFELEGLSIELPQQQRVSKFDVTLDPLPRTADGRLDRPEIDSRYSMGRLRAPVDAERGSDADDHIRSVVALVQTAIGRRAAVGSTSNLELDLGLDSMERVELLAWVEECFGRPIPDDVAQRIFTVRDLADAFRGTEARNAVRPSWEQLLCVERPGDELHAIRPGRPLTAIAVFATTHTLVRTLVRPRVDGLEHLPREGPFIITPNHQTYVDPFVIMGVLPLHVLRRVFFVGAAEYFETRVTSWLARRLNIVPVDPDANLLSAMRAGAFGLTHGKVLILFPEGERSIDGRVKTFKKGAAILSQHLEAPIVPVAIKGIFEMWPRNRPLDWHRLLPGSGHVTSVRFGAPIAAARGTPYADHIAAVRSAVEQMW